MQTYELIGIGFGPSNIALAIALQEQQHHAGAADMFFIEKQDSFAWHGDMLLDNSHMQISFLKDLATLRNPASRFTFLNYLHQKERLSDFINLKTFYPSRHEFSDYLRWAADQFSACCSYGEEVIEVQPELQDGKVRLLRVRSRHRDGRVTERLARNLVIGVGGSANIPEIFRGLREDARVFHSSSYLRHIAAFDKPARIAVIGAGQSATEIFLDLHGRNAGHEVDFIMRSRNIKPSDDSPFVNEVFNPEYTDYVYRQDEQTRDALMQEFMQTNYSAPDLALIEQVYQVFYKQKVTGQQRHRLLRCHNVERARAEADGVWLDLHDLDGGSAQTRRYDAVVLGTGYTRELHKDLLAPLASYLPHFAVGRDYRLQSTPEFEPAVFLQGSCEPSHGISDTLLSVIAIRTAEIGQALRERDENAPFAARRAMVASIAAASRSSPQFSL